MGLVSVIFSELLEKMCVKYVENTGVENIFKYFQFYNQILALRNALYIEVLKKWTIAKARRTKRAIVKQLSFWHL